MFQDIPLAAYVLSGSCAAVAVAFSFPALTAGGGSGMRGISEADFVAAVASEMSYCQTTPEAVNCVCFANTSGMILAYKSDKPRHSAYMNQRDLARSQARQRC